MRMAGTCRGVKAVGLLLIFIWGLVGSRAFAVEPEVRNLSVRGLQVGGTTTVVVDGDDLGTNPRLMLPFPAKQVRNPKSTDKQATFEVTLEGSVIPGYYSLRVA